MDISEASVHDLIRELDRRSDSYVVAIEKETAKDHYVVTMEAGGPHRWNLAAGLETVVDTEELETADEDDDE